MRIEGGEVSYQDMPSGMSQELNTNCAFRRDSQIQGLARN
jgi:hypothetical protein